MRKLFMLIFCLIGVNLHAEWNNPYSQKEKNEKIIYRAFSGKPKSLDPATSYVENEWAVACQIYEPLYQYKYLKRPFELEPLLAATMPIIRYENQQGEEIKDPDSYQGKLTMIWRIQIKKNILFQDHPCFAKDAQGNYLYHDFKNSSLKFKNLFELPSTGTREVTVHDFIYQMYRMADPRIPCPIYNVVLNKIEGMDSVARGITDAVETVRQQRLQESKARGEIVFNREEDEKKNPIIIPYLTIPCTGLRVLDDYTFEIRLTEKYPQFKYWLSMLFFSPVPWEAIAFYEQSTVKAAGYSLLQYPVGTGPFKFEDCNRNARMILSRNKNFHEEYFPTEASPSLEDLLRKEKQLLPLVDKIIWSKEPEVTSQWLKYQQGYLESSGIPEQSFTSAISVNTGASELSEDMRQKNMKLIKAPRTSVYYLGFNMLDPVVGGYEERKCKLRQAVSIAIDMKEYIDIFLNGRGIVAQSPIPPGIFGNEEGEKGLNPFTYDWDEKSHSYRSKNLAYAKQLLAEAGYPNGIDPQTGKSLILFFDTGQYSATMTEWYKNKLGELNISIEFRQTDFNRLLEKLENGSAQIYMAGWNADYPDPENFLFLLYGNNAAVKYKGENKSNYENPEFDALFEKIKSMENSPERLELLRKAIAIVQHDAPWKPLFYPVDYILYHSWYENILAGGVINNASKYQNIDLEKRNAYRAKHNEPQILIPLLVLAGVFSIFFVTIYRFLKKGAL